MGASTRLEAEPRRISPFHPSNRHPVLHPSNNSIERNTFLTFSLFVLVLLDVFTFDARQDPQDRPQTLQDGLKTSQDRSKTPQDRL